MSFANPALLLCLATAFATASAHAEETYAENSVGPDSSELPALSFEYPNTGLVGTFNAWLLYSSDFGATGGASGKFKLPNDDGSWFLLGGELAERRQSLNFAFHKDGVLSNGANLDVTLRGSTQETRSVLPFDTATRGIESRLSWALPANAETAVYVGLARNRIYNPDSSLSALIQPDVGTSNRSYLGTEYRHSLAFSGPVAKLRYELSAEIASASSGENLGRLRADVTAGGTLAAGSVVWRADLQGGAIEANGGDVSIGDRFILGGATLRGFAFGGFGPHDGTQALGGKRFAAMRLDMQFPNAFGAETWLVPGLHLDAGSLWKLDNTASGSIDDSGHLRSTVGVTLSARMGAGLLSLSVSHALQSQSTDATQPLQVRFSSTF